MSAGPWEPRAEDGMAATLWRMVAIAGVWFGLLALVMVLTTPEAAPGAPRDRAMQSASAEPPAEQVEPPRTRALRHGGSGAAPVP